MTDPLATVGDDFERYYPDVRRVTVTSIDARTGATLATVEDVAAAKLIDKRSTGPARSGSVPNRQNEWWVRVDQLGFEIKTQDRLTEADGTVWVLDEVGESVGALVRCPATKKR